MGDNGVSFVVPVYNKADWLPAVLARIKAQRGDFDRQYVFVDDGSTDNSLELLKTETADWQDCIIESQPNAGSAAATNRGIALATKPFVKFVDADDLLHADATQVLLDALAQDDRACLAFGQKTHFEEANNLDLDGTLSAPEVIRHERPLKAATFRSLFNPTQFLARTEALRAVGGCDERVVHSQEYALTMRLARQWDFLELDQTIAFLPQEVGSRLSNNEGRQLQRVTRAVELFLSDFPDLPWGFKQATARRMAYRAWKYHRRIDGVFWPTSPVFWRQARAWLPILGGHDKFVAKCAEIFDTADPRAVTAAMKERAS